MSGYQCVICEGERPPAWLLTPLSGGDTMAVCQQDIPIAFATSIATVLGADPEALYESIRRHVDREHAKAAKAPRLASEAPPAPPDDPPGLGSGVEIGVGDVGNLADFVQPTFDEVTP